MKKKTSLKEKQRRLKQKTPGTNYLDESGECFQMEKVKGGYKLTGENTPIIKPVITTIYPGY